MISIVLTFFLLSNMDAAPTASIQSFIQAKQVAVNENNEKQFLSLVDSKDPFYWKEQQRWFQDAVQWVEPGTFRLQVVQVLRKSPSLYEAVIQQKYRRAGKVYSLRFPLRFRHTQRGWQEVDFPFWVQTQNGITIKYSHPQLKTQAMQAFSILRQARQQMNQKFSFSNQPIQVKLYHHPDWFRQSVKLSLPTWAGGWNEYGESIKLFVDPKNKGFLRAGITHEFTHQVVSGLTKDNASYWLQEGAAMYYERHLLTKRKPLLLTNHSLYSIPVLEKTNLEKLSDREAARFYLSCYHAFFRLVQQYGEQRIGRLFAELRRFPFVDQESERKIQLNNQRTRKALQKVMVSSFR